jgi:hypothetical protein
LQAALEHGSSAAHLPTLPARLRRRPPPPAQIHFFPIIMDGKQLYDVMVERCGPSQNSGPKE